MHAADDRALLDALLDYALQQLGADHVTFCSWDAAGSRLTVLHGAGSLTHEEVVPTGRPIPIGELDAQVYAPTNLEPRIYRADDPGTLPGVRRFLRRVGAATEITFPVVDQPGSRWVMEAFYCDPAHPAGEEELSAGTRLAPLAAAAVDREALLERIAEAETRFRTLVEQLPAITYVDRIDGTAVYTSPQVQSLLGYTSEDWQAQRAWLGKVHPEDRARVEADYVDTIATGQLADLEYRVLAADGRIVWFYDQARVLPDERGRPALIQGVMLDITDRKRVERDLGLSEARRRQVLEEMLRAEEAERARIATELHDDTIQVMTAALFLLDRLRRSGRSASPEAMAGTLDEARETLAQAVERTRRMTFELRPPLLETQGLQPAVRDLAEEAARAGRFRVELDLQVGRHPFLIEDLAYRTVAEALSNARRHAGARVVRIRLGEQDGQLCGEVTDDGQGFDVPRALDRSRMRMHLGLDAMCERVALAGGKVDLRSHPGRGTTVAFTIPLRAA
jgi:two-component system, NarL family, sensor histidine kinase UhpB